MLNFIRTIFLPAAVFQSVIVGGAYGTGREVVEYISQYGPLGGLYVIVTIALSFALVLAVSFEFARVFSVWNYRSYVRELLGSAWVIYELLFLALLILILAITGAAAGSVLHDRFHIPTTVGTGLMFVTVVILNYFGRRLVKQALTIGAVLLIGILLYYFVIVFGSQSNSIIETFTSAATEPGWFKSGLTFSIYNSALVPVIIYCATGLKSRREAVSAGVLAGVLGAFPALIFHLSFMAGYPTVLSEDIPIYWMIEQLGQQLLLTVYVIILFATIVQTGVGVLQGFNERLDGWRNESKGEPLRKSAHATLAGLLLLVSLLLAKLGIINLVAKGYSALAWGFFFVFTLPTISVGIYKMSQRH